MGRDDPSWPDTVFSELWQAQNGPSVMVKRGQQKYFRFDNESNSPEQLFDLVADPEERTNLDRRAEYLPKRNELAVLRD